MEPNDMNMFKRAILVIAAGILIASGAQAGQVPNPVNAPATSTGGHGACFSGSGSQTNWQQIIDCNVVPGGGNMVGPGSSVTNNFPTFADTTGKVLQDSGIHIGTSGGVICLLNTSCVFGILTSNGFQDNKTSANPTVQIDTLGRLLLSAQGSFSTALSIGGNTAGFEIAATSGAASQSNIRLSATAAVGGTIFLAHSRATTPGSFSVLSPGDLLGAQFYCGDDGASYNTCGGEHRCIALSTGTISTGIIPGQCIFSAMNAGGSLADLFRYDWTNGFVVLSGFTASPANANDVLSPTGTGIVTINPATLGSMDNMTVGATTPAAAKFTTITETSLLISNAAPTISSGFGTSPSVPNNNGTHAFTVNVGTGGTATSGVIGLPTAAHGWICVAQDITTQSSTVFITKQIAPAAASACTIGNFNNLGAAAAWVASDVLTVTATAY